MGQHWGNDIEMFECMSSMLLVCVCLCVREGMHLS